MSMPLILRLSKDELRRFVIVRFVVVRLVTTAGATAFGSLACLRPAAGALVVIAQREQPLILL